ncbi:MAG: dihydrodipicolinate synthase family protein [Phycisphaerae bacterium]
MDRSFIRGVIPPIVTPVDDNERLDEAALKRVVDHVLAGGVHGILALGSTGEFWGFGQEEAQRVLAVTLQQVNRRVPVYCGIGAITTKECIAIAKMAHREGAQAVTILPPMFITPNDEELFAHFKAVAEATPLPLLIYNNPDRMNVNISAALLERLAGVPNIAGVKDSSGDMSLTAEYIRRTQGTGFRVMAGRDILILATLVYGGVGCVASTANVVPALVVKIYEEYTKGNLEAAREAQFKLAPLRVAFGLGSFPSVLKDSLNLLGLNVGKLVKPNGGCSEANLAKLKKILQDVGALP